MKMIFGAAAIAGMLALAPEARADWYTHTQQDPFRINREHLCDADVQRIRDALRHIELQLRLAVLQPRHVGLAHTYARAKVKLAPPPRLAQLSDAILHNAIFAPRLAARVGKSATHVDKCCN